MRRRSFLKSVARAVLGTLAIVYVPGRPWALPEEAVTSLDDCGGFLLPEEYTPVLEKLFQEGILRVHGGVSLITQAFAERMP